MSRLLNFPQSFVTRSIYLILALGVATFVGSLIFYPANGDDAWFAEQAWWLVKDGIVRSEFFAGMLGYETQQFAYHKLHIWIAALSIKVFGFSQFSLKFITLAFFIGFLLVTRRYFRRVLPHTDTLTYLLFLAIIFLNSLIVEIGFVYRPEISMMLFGFVSYFFLRTPTNTSRRLVYAGVFAGLAALVHLNGLIFIAAGAGLLLLQRQYRTTVIFCVSATVILSLYFIDILPNHLTEYWQQFRHDPAISDSQFSLTTVFVRIGMEVTRFFGHGYEAAYSLLFLVVAILYRKVITEHAELKAAMIYFLIAAFTLSVIAPSKANFYLLYYLPYTAIILAVLIRHILDTQQNTRHNIVTGIFILVFILANLNHSISYIRRSHNPHMVELNAQVVQRFDIQPGDTIYSSLRFIFNSLENHNIQGIDTYFQLAKRHHREVSAEEFFQIAKTHQRKYILLEAEYMTLLKLTSSTDTGVSGYRYLGAHNGYHVYRIGDVSISQDQHP